MSLLTLFMKFWPAPVPAIMTASDKAAFIMVATDGL